MMTPMEAASRIRDVPDFPKKGIVFKDITPLLCDAEAFACVIDELCVPFSKTRIDIVAGIESRGFLLATPVAYRLKAGVVPIRKKGKLPRETRSVDYQLEYGVGTLEAHADAFSKNASVLLVDDVLATGGTAKASCDLIEALGARIVGLAFLIELSSLGGREKLPGRDIHSLFVY